jgi:5-methylcytosine-specific restriction endonuclease McrA
LLRKTLAGVEPTVRRKIPKPWVRAAFERQKGICPRCTRFIEARELSGDHKIPLVAGGRHEPDNITAMHRRCNSAKGSNDMVTESKRTGRGIASMLGLDPGGIE